MPEQQRTNGVELEIEIAVSLFRLHEELDTGVLMARRLIGRIPRQHIPVFDAENYGDGVAIVKQPSLGAGPVVAALWMEAGYCEGLGRRPGKIIPGG
jgi:hypothetical protein